MARARDEPDSGTFDVVDGIVERVDLELAAVARAGVDVTYAERAAEHLADLRLQRVAAPKGFVASQAGALSLSRLNRSGAGCAAWLEVVSAVRKVERLVDQRKVRNDVADDRVLEGGPVLPRRVVRMTAQHPIPRHPHRAQPAPGRATLQPPRGQTPARWATRLPHGDEPSGSPPARRATRPTGFQDLIKAHRDPRRNIAVAAADHVIARVTSSYGGSGQSTRASCP